MSSTTSGAGELRLGAHMSIAGGLVRAVERAAAVEAAALQIFVKSARQWKAPALDPAAVEAFREALETAGLGPYTLAHATYLINVASPNPLTWERSIDALGLELDICVRLGVPYLVLHPGSHVGSGVESGLARVVEALDRVLGVKRRESTKLLLETTAGQGTNLGHDFEHLGRIVERARFSEGLGVCFDTCHVLAAGYELRDRRSFEKTISELDATVGLERLLAFHLNDSVHELGSRKDRHEHIGQGRLGLEPFRLLLNDRRFRDLPMVLETPKQADLREDRRNLGLLRGLVARRPRRRVRSRHCETR